MAILLKRGFEGYFGSGHGSLKFLIVDFLVHYAYKVALGGAYGDQQASIMNLDDWCVARLGDKKTTMALTYTVVYRKKTCARHDFVDTQ